MEIVTFDFDKYLKNSEENELDKFLEKKRKIDIKDIESKIIEVNINDETYVYYLQCIIKDNKIIKEIKINKKRDIRVYFDSINSIYKNEDKRLVFTLRYKDL